MKKIVLISAIAMAPVGALAADGTQCAKGGDVRTIEVRSPGQVGKACDLVYTRQSGAVVSTPYHANNSAGFCATKADEIIGNLTADGFSCTALVAQAPAASDLAQSQSDAPSSVEVAETIPAAEPEAEPTPEPVVQTAASEPAPAPEASPTPTPTPTPTLEYTQDPAEALAAIDDAPAAAPATVAEEKVENIAATTPSGTPVDLTAAAAPARPSAPRPERPAAGVLTGQTPDPVRVALLEEQEAENNKSKEAPAVTNAVTPVENVSAVDASASVDSGEAAQKPVRPARVRPAPAIIKGVLGAQAAAWNEGNLEAFMAGYWNDRDLRFVSGGEVTRGWSTILKRYQKRYGGTGEMGVLSFDDLDVQMLTDDIATVVGRFALDKDGANSTGAFTLVMQQFDGRWRIVHDHTVADAETSTEE